MSGLGVNQDLSRLISFRRRPIHAHTQTCDSHHRQFSITVPVFIRLIRGRGATSAGSKMLSRNRLLSALTHRSLAGIVVLSMSLMSFGVDSCETSCLFGHAECADELIRSSASAQSMGSMPMGEASEYARLLHQTVASSASTVPRMEPVSCRSDEFCKDASTSVMRPTGRAEIQRARSATIGAAFAQSGALGEQLVRQSGSSPPRTADPHLVSMTLRI
jgi:hypothetical protein